MLTKDEQFLLEDLKNCLTQSSWDWPADLRFAEHVGYDAELIIAATESTAPSPLRIYASAQWRKLTQRRLRGLRGLIKKGFVDAWWSGTGPAGVCDFGVNRMREYCIKDEFKS